MTTADLSGCTILLVDDEEANLDLLQEILEVEGYRSLVRTSDARQAIPLFEFSRPDLVLLDLHMPHRTGFDVLGDIRERTTVGEYLPVLVLTADATAEAKERALSGGARDFLTKPFDVAEVLLRVHNLLETRVLHRLQREAREQAEAAEARSALLAEASGVLGGSLDGTTTLAQLARLLAPGWAQGCTVLLREGERLVPAGAAHEDSAREAELTAAASALLRDASGAEPLADGSLALLVGRAEVESGGGESSLLAAPLRAQGRTLGWLVVARPAGWDAFTSDDEGLVRELGARAALAVENARLLASAEWATRARERMLSIVAHDLRNPLAVIAMYAEMLQSMLPPDGDRYQEDALRSIFQCTERMQRLIEDLLDVSRLQQGAFALERVPQPLGSLLRKADGMLRPLAEARRIELTLDVQAAAASHRVDVDGDRVLQVLSNLVGNALKFTPEEGGVTVTCAEQEGWLRVTVADTGPGIPAALLPQIFGAFWQAGDRDRRGVGLGLWIVRAMVEAHGGRIWAESREGEGAVFHFTLPLAAPEENQSAEVLVPAPLG